MQEKIIMKYGELWLKSEYVRSRFIRRLAENLRRMLKANGINFRLEVARDMMILETENKKAVDTLGKVFGISWFAKARETKPDMKSIEKEVLSLARKIGNNESFAIRASRSEKSFDFTSKEIENEIGRKIKRRVDLTNPDFTIFVEVKKTKAYVYSEKVRGLGGMPVGVSGKVLSLLSGGIDSAVASWMLMKRGCSVDFVYFHPEVFTSEKNRERVLDILKKLREYSPEKLNLYIVPFGKIQEEIIKNCERRQTCVLCRRMMYRISEMLARELDCKAIATGENLAQVASQTLDNIFVENEVISIPVFRPLLGFDKEETMILAEKIGTYDISIQTHGCCTITPKKPATKARLDFILKEEGRIKDINTLLKNIINKRERFVI